jgi:hypothetical protein
LVWLVGCSGQNVIAGDDKTKAEQLEASLPTWCSSTCVELSACPEAQGECDCSAGDDECTCSSGAGLDENCPGQCREALLPYTRGGDVCAAAGQRFQQCIDDEGCGVLDGSNRCQPSEADVAVCPELADVAVDEPAPVLPGPGYGTAGSANVVPPGPSGNPNYPGPAVTCQGAYGSGGGIPAGEPTSRVTCEEGRDICSDGHDYSWICVVSSQGEAACSCLLDEQVVGAFDPGPGCPMLTEVNAGCGWNLAEL